MRIIIIGSQGFIGEHAYAFFSEKADVWGADVINRSGQENFILLSTSNTDFHFLFSRSKFDVCINASGNGNVSKSVEDPNFDFQLNVHNTFRILEAIRINNPECKFINFSSAAVYGNVVSLPVKETDEIAPISPYGFHKLYTELLCREYFQLYSIRSVSLRIFSVYGDNLRKQLFWDIFLKSKKSNDLLLFGTGNESRDFIFIDDLIHALDVIIRKSPFDAEPINVASGVETKIRDAAAMLCSHLNKDIRVSFNNAQKQGDPFQWRADITSLRNLGFTPQVNFEAGVKKLAAWMKSLHDE